MDEYTEVVETEEETDQEKSFGREIAEALAVGIVSGRVTESLIHFSEESF